MIVQSDIAVEACRELLMSLDSPLARECADEITNRPSAYVARTIDASSYVDGGAFHRDYCAISLMSKWQHFDLGVDRAKVALDKFLLSEQQCLETNRRVRLFDRDLYKRDHEAYWILHLARRKIETVLRDFSWDDAHCYMGFSSGASSDLRRTHGDAYYKFGCEQPTVTRDSSVLAACVISQVPSWSSTISTETSVLGILERLNIVRGNVVTTVPKSAKTDRVIAKEPSMNMFIQRGIGKLIRLRLKGVGIDLDDQRRNQDLALMGSISGDLATIDLASASDSISLGLVEWLLPPDWASAMKLCRSPQGRLPDGTWITYQKVSSMGNGFTFELESLIFWAIANATCAHQRLGVEQVSVYGDDIIVPCAASRPLQRVLGECGFNTNVDKTFDSGPFRESCGKHYFLGRDVTPLYVKERTATLERKFWLANSIAQLAFRLLGVGWGRHADLQRAYCFVLQSLPESVRRPSIPWNFGDGGLAGDFDEVAPRYDPTGRVFIVKHRVRVFITIRTDGLAALSKSIWSINQFRSDYPGDRILLWCIKHGEYRLQQVTFTSSTRTLQRYRLRTVKSKVARWDGLGPWVG